MSDKKFKEKVNNCLIKIADGNKHALEELFCITKKYLYVVAVNYLDDESKAEDVLSDAYYKVVRSISTFDKNQNGYNWIIEIVKNTAFTQNLKDRVHASISIEDVTILDKRDYFDELLNSIMIEQAQKYLSEQEKAIVYDYFFERKTLQEIADKLNLPKTTTYDLIQRILEKMRRVLK